MCIRDSSFSILVISVMAILYLLPSQWRRWYFSITAGAMIVMWAIEWSNPLWRIEIPAAKVGPAAVIIFAVILVAMVVSQTWRSLSLRWKMGGIVAVLFLGMAAVAISGYSGLQALRYQISN